MATKKTLEELLAEEDDSGLLDVKPRASRAVSEDARIVLEGKEEWEFLPDPKGRMLDFVGGFPITAQQEGRWRRVGDTREPDRWMAWGESDKRNGTARNVRGTEI